MAGNQQRAYDASDLKELMDNTGGWADSWDDVLFYLHGPAVRDADFSRKEVPELIQAIERLKKKHVKFTTDYRIIWHDITGESGKDLPPPEGVKTPKTNPIELECRYLRHLKFPASKKQVVAEAKHRQAPQRVLDVLDKIEDQTYKDMPGLLEAVGDVSWDHD